MIGWMGLVASFTLLLWHNSHSRQTLFRHKNKMIRIGWFTPVFFFGALPGIGLFIGNDFSQSLLFIYLTILFALWCIASAFLYYLPEEDTVIKEDK